MFVDTFSGWTEAFPTKYETAQVVVKKLLEGTDQVWLSNHDRIGQCTGFCVPGKPEFSHLPGE